MNMYVIYSQFRSETGVAQPFQPVAATFRVYFLFFLKIQFGMLMDANQDSDRRFGCRKGHSSAMKALTNTLRDWNNAFESSPSLIFAERWPSTIVRAATACVNTSAPVQGRSGPPPATGGSKKKKEKKNGGRGGVARFALRRRRPTRCPDNVIASSRRSIDSISYRFETRARYQWWPRQPIASKVRFVR